jgi:hypothetical protein
MSDVAAAPGPRSALDREGLLAALVLAPATYSRNRFFELYTDQEVRRVRRRAGQLRSVIQQLARHAVTPRRDPPIEGGFVRLHYEVAAIGLRRTIVLAPLELALLRYALGRARDGAAALAVDDPDRRDIEAALSRLAPVSVAVPPSPRPV